MKTLKVELIKEGWVKFRRFHCKEGYIDEWMGDAINHPDNESESKLQLNSFKTYWRCNGKRWEYFPWNSIMEYLDLREVFSAEEIWNEAEMRELGKMNQKTHK